MKTIICLVVLLQCFVFSGKAQSLTETLGGIPTNYKIVSDTVDLKATDQFIIQRAEKKAEHRSNMESYSGYGYAYGYGYQSLHLEFIAKESYVWKEIETKNRNYDKLLFTFYDANDEILASRSWNTSEVAILYHLPSDNQRFFYSIDLLNIPIVLLEKTVKINLIREVSDRAN
ncbi:hypothetical protein SLH46_03735 [Draconibacterium sp. IB214405]|uniref:hypothetical protein n=1 Tax=Draconibacterium sp. IB214405 TaxID=3097352 RepID=UPI002A1841F4|nr:hypothetical protein [Draconibacterium sp. IB214405]MDX8338282.1 hypothetical protein [Draconibacterium sp. IB214405]